MPPKIVLRVFYIITIVFWGNFLELNSSAEARSAPSLSSLKELNLETAVQIALTDSPSLDAARERVVQAKHVVVQYRAGFWPRLNGYLTYSRVDSANKGLDDDLDLSGIDSSDELEDYYDQLQDDYAVDLGPRDYYSAELSARWLLFDGFEREFSYAAARHGLKRTKYSLEDARRILIGAIVQAYLGALLAKDNINIAKADEAFNKRLLDETKIMQKAGLSSLSDVMNFEIRRNYANSQLLDAQSKYESALFGLAALMGISDARIPAGLELTPLDAETDQMQVPPDVEKLLSYAKTHRPDILAQNATIDAVHSAVGAARGQFFPELALFASLSGTREEDYDFEEDDFGNTVGVSLSYNFFAGGRHRARYLEAKSRLREYEKTLKELNTSVVAAVRSAATTVSSAQKQFILQQTNAKLATKTRDLVKKEYLAGQGSLVRLNEAQKDLITAQSYLAQARVTLRQAWLNMEKESGQILDRYKGYFTD